MMQKNKLEKSFGPAGTTAGYVLFGVGIISCFTLFGIGSVFMILIGAFVGFSSTAALIDFDKRRIKYTNILFGVIETGKWINIENSMKLGIRKSNTSWRSYSRSNRVTDIEDNDFRICLIDNLDNEIMEIFKLNTLEDAEYQAKKLSKQLNLNLV